MAKAQILVATSEADFAGGLTANLESLGFAVIAVASSLEEAWKKTEETSPDLVLLDLAWLREGEKDKAAQRLRKRFPQGLLYLAADEDLATLKQMKITHSFDYLRKDCDLRELETIIDIALYRQQMGKELKEGLNGKRESEEKRRSREIEQTAQIGKITTKYESEADRYQRLEEALQAERKKLYTVLDTLPAYVVLLAQDYSVSFANLEFIKRFGAPAGRKCYDFLFGRTSPCPDCETYKVLNTDDPHEWEWTGPDGCNYQIYDFPFKDTDGSPLILEMGVDVTVLKEKEAETKRAHRALKTLSAVNKAVVRAQTEAELLQRVCGTVIEEGGYRLAWIGYAEDDLQKTVRPMAQAGYEAGYLETLEITWGDTELGRGPTGTAIRTGKPVLARNIPTDPHFAPWRQEAMQRGYASSLVLPLLVEDTAFGALNIYAGEAGAFDAAEVMLLSDLAVDVSFGIMALRGKEERRRMAEALRRSYEEMEARVQDRTQELAESNATLQSEISERLWSEKKLRESEERYRSLVDLSPDAIAVQSQGRYLFINPAGARLMGAADPGELVGQKVADVIHPDYRELVSERICAVNAPGRQTNLQEIKIVRLDGKVVDVGAAGAGITYQGQPAVLVMMRDITARKRAEEELRFSNQRLDLLAETASQLLASASPQEVVFGLCQRVMAFIDCDVCFNFLLDEKAGRLQLHNCFGISNEEACKIEWIDFGMGVCGCSARDGCRLVAEDIQTTSDSQTKLLKGFGIQAYACHPLKVQDRVLGTLAFGTRKRAFFAAEELELMNAVADLVSIAMDRMQVEKALRESQQDLNRAQAVSHTGSWRMNVLRNVLYWSDENHRIFGIPRGTPLTYETFLSTVHPEDLAYVDQKWKAALRGEPYDIEHRIVVGDTVKWLRELAELEFDAQGRLLGGFGTTQDITERKQVEEALQESESRYRNLFQSNQAVMLLIDPATGEIVDANPAACSFYGWSQEQLTAKKIMDINLAPQEQIFGNMRQVADGQESHFFFKHRLANGESRDVEVYSSPFQVYGRKLLYSIIHDNTARKEAEETLKISRDFLGIANRHTQMEPLIQDYVAAVQEHTGCEAVAIRILDDQGKIPYAAYSGFQEEFIACESHLSIMSDHCLCIKVIKGEVDPALPCYTPGSSLYINRVSHLVATSPPGLLGLTRNVCQQFGYESVALVPIIFGGSILGLIHLADHRENMVPLSLVERLERIALTLGTAINRVRAEEGLRLALIDSRQRQAEITALLQATRAVLKAGDYQEIIRSIYDSCKELIGATSGYIALLSPDGQGNDVLFLDTGERDCTVDPSLPMPIRGLRAEAYQTCKTVYDNDYPSSEYARFLPPGHAALENVLFSPLVMRGRAVGLLGLGNKPGGFNENDVHLAAGFGELAAMALSNKRAEEEREKLIRELEMERARLQAIITSAPEAIVVADEKGQVLMTNPAAELLYSHPGGCVPNDPSCVLFQFCQADGTACVPADQPLLRSAREGETHRNVEMVLAWPDGQCRDLLVNTAPIRDQQGLSSGAVGLFQDITRRKETEEKIRKLNLELSERIREVSERTLQLEAANKELEAFSYSVSHDLRTPLRAIEGFARMLLEDYTKKLDQEGLRLLGVIRSNTQIMAELIDDLLALSRLGRQEIRAQEINLGGLVTSVFGELQTQMQERKMELILTPLPPAFGDRSLINQVLVNLLGNAVKFTKPREKAIIEVGGWTEEKENIYFVKDNGVGFDMRYVGKIFGVFQRLHPREDFEGTGVGLALVQRIITRHGGRLWAKGKVDNGAAFYFTLPRKGGEH